MEHELIYPIGEAIMLEVDNVVDVNYPKGNAINSLYVLMEDGKRYELALKAIE